MVIRRTASDNQIVNFILEGAIDTLQLFDNRNGRFRLFGHIFLQLFYLRVNFINFVRLVYREILKSLEICVIKLGGVDAIDLFLEVIFNVYKLFIDV